MRGSETTGWARPKCPSPWPLAIPPPRLRTRGRDESREIALGWAGDSGWARRERGLARPKCPSPWPPAIPPPRLQAGRRTPEAGSTNWISGKPRNVLPTPAR